MFNFQITLFTNRFHLVDTIDDFNFLLSLLLYYSFIINQFISFSSFFPSLYEIVNCQMKNKKQKSCSRAMQICSQAKERDWQDTLIPIVLAVTFPNAIPSPSSRQLVL